MVSVVTGYGNGLANGSKDVLGASGELGNAAQGRAGERVTVNAANGNLVVQGRDEYLVGVGPDIDLLRTYNSRGVVWDGDNNDNWRIGYYRKVELSSGTANGTGSIAKRVEADGSERLYTYNSGTYVSKEGGGQHDTLSFDAGSQSWTWTDGDSGVKETYALGGGLYRLTQITDPAGNAVKVSYDAGTGRITTLSTHKAGSGADETITLNYSGNQLSSITTSYQEGGQSKTRSVTSYTYYPAGSGAKTGKLQTVTTDLTPGVAGHADGKVYAVTYDYDANGRLSSIQQTDGSQFTIGYDANGRVASVSSPSDLGVRSTVFDYSVPGTTTVQEKLGTQILQSSVLKYGTAGELLEVSGAVMGGAAFKQSYTYDSVTGDLLTVTNAASQTTTYGYGGAGGAPGAWTRRTDHAGNVVDRSYDPVTRLLLTETAYSIADSDGAAGAAQPGGARKTQFVYDTTNIAKRRLAYVVGPQGEVTHQIYNSEGQLTRQVQYTGALFTAGSPSFTSLESWVTTAAQAQTLDRQVTEYDYDLRGQVREERRYATASLSNNVVVLGGLSTTLYTYDAFGRLLHRQDASGVKLTYEYDGLGRVTKSLDTNNVSTLYSYDDAGRKTSVQLANGQTTVQLFDTQGNLVSSDVMGAGNTEANPKWLGKTEYAYDALGRLWRTSDATGVKTFTLYDVSGRKSADIAANGQLTEYLYDAAGRLIQQIAYITPLSQAKLDGLTATSKISDTGIRPAIAAGQDRITTYYYDTAGRLTGLQDAEGYLTHTKYDGMGAVTSQTTYFNVTAVTRLDVTLGTTRSTVPTQPTATEDAARDRAIRNLYDASGRLGAQINGENALTVWTYDAAGNQLSQLRRSAVLSAAEAAYNLTQLKALTPLADDEFTQWLYNGQGRQIAQVNAEGHLTEYRYDAAGRLQETLQYLKQAFKPVISGSPVTLRKLVRTDLDTLPTSLGTPTPLKTSRSYNNLGLLERETAVDGTVTYYQYDNLQRLKSTTLAEGQPEWRQRLVDYDDWGRVNSTRMQGDATRVTTTYDAAGRRTSVTDARGHKTVYYYDKEGRQRYAILIDPATGGEVTETIYSTFSELSASVSYSARLSTTDANALTGGSVSQALTDKISLLSDAPKDNRSTVSYNRRGLIQQAIDALGYKTDTTYNAFGQIDREVRDIDPVGTANARWLTLDYGYNRRGNLTRVLSSGAGLVSTTTRSTFDALGRLYQTLNEFDITTTYTYLRDSGSGRQVQIARPAGSTTTTYDALGRVLTHKDRNGNTVTYTHDAVTYVPGTTYTIEIEPFDKGAWIYVYRKGDPRGSGHRVDEPSLTWQGVRTQLAVKRAPTLPPGETVSYIDNLEEIPPLKGRVTQFAYDAAGRQRFAVDAEGYVTEIRHDDANARTTTLRYANRLSGGSSYTPATFAPALASFTAALPGLGGSTSITRELDRAGRLRIETDGNGVQTQFGYDAAGRLETEVRAANILGQASTTRYKYNAAGLRSEVIRGDGSAAASTTRFEHDALGRLWKTIDPRGVALAEGAGDWEKAERVRLGYPADLTTLSPEALAADKAALLSRYTTETQYDAAGRAHKLIQVVSSATDTTVTPLVTLKTTTQYDAFGNAVQVTDARGYNRYQVFDKLGRVVQSIDAERYLTAHTYDSFGNLTASLRVDTRVQGSITAGQAVTLAATPPGSGAYVLADATLDHLTTRAYDRNNRLLRETDAENHVEGTVGALDAFGQRLSARNKLGAVVSYTYDRLGRILTETLPVTVKVAGQDQAVVNEYQYDSRGNRITSIEAKGLSEQRTTQMRYDGANRLTLRIGMAYMATAADGSTQTVTPADQLRYDARGNLIEQISHGQLQANGTTVTGGKRSVAYYDAQDRKALEISADRVASHFSYDTAGHQVVQTVYATRIPDATTINPAGSAPVPGLDAVNDRTLRTRYDELGRKVETVLDKLYAWSSGDGTNLVISGLTPQNTVLQQLFYDAVGNLTERKDGRGNSSFEYFDGIGRRLLSIDAGGLPSPGTTSAPALWPPARRGTAACCPAAMGARRACWPV